MALKLVLIQYGFNGGIILQKKHMSFLLRTNAIISLRETAELKNQTSFTRSAGYICYKEI